MGIDALFNAGLDEHFDRLDIVVNSAAVFQQRDLLAVSLDGLGIDHGGQFASALPDHAARRCEKWLANPQPGGAIVNICDAGALTDRGQKYPHHGISKSALWMLDAGQRAGAGSGYSRECHRSQDRC